MCVSVCGGGGERSWRIFDVDDVIDDDEFCRADEMKNKKDPDLFERKAFPTF